MYACKWLVGSWYSTGDFWMIELTRVEKGRRRNVKINLTFD